MKKAIKIVGIIYSAAYLILLIMSIAIVISLIGTEEGQNAEGLDGAFRAIFAVIHGAMGVIPAILLLITLVPTILIFIPKIMPKPLWIVVGIFNLIAALPLGILCLVYAKKRDEIEGIATQSNP